MLVDQNTCFVHTKLAEVYTTMNDFPQALRHYNIAMSLSSMYAPAISGLDRLEKLMRGEDPDEDGIDDGEETDGSVEI